MARIITKQLAERIIAKLGGVPTGSGSAHDDYAIEHNGQIIAVTSIRRGSEKDLGHDHMPKDLHIGPNKAKKIGQCQIQLEGYIKLLQDNGTIDPLDEGEEGAVS